MNVILSIRPEFVEKIFSGEKQYEYRKILFKQKVETVYIYASSPVRKIVGEFKIAEIICDAPMNIWTLTREHSGVSKSFFQKYYAGKDKGVALKITGCKKYENAVEPTTVIANFKVPQSFFYTSMGQLEKVAQKTVGKF